MGQVNLVIDEIAQHAIDCATSLEDVEHQPDRRLHLLVGIGGDRAGGRANVAARQIEEQLAALGLGAAASMRPFSRCSSASLIVPFRPRRRRSL